MKVIKYSVDFTDIDDVETLLKSADDSIGNAVEWELSAGILTALSDLRLSLELLLKALKYRSEEFKKDTEEKIKNERRKA